jgi:hypothetical protein
MGEGIETTLSAWQANESLDTRHLTPDTCYWSALSLGNLGGRAVDRLRHPSATRKDSRGRVTAVTVPGIVPAYEPGDRVLLPPAGVMSVILLGDGDSDRFSTECVLRRAARRFQFADAAMTVPAPREVRAAWADDGGDFNSMLMERAA